MSPPDPKYTTVDASWAVESIPGNASSTMILNGTVQEIYKQLTDINPSYEDLLNDYLLSKQATTDLPDTFHSYGAMSDLPSNCGYCNVCTRRWDPAVYTTILNGINYLKTLPSRPSVPPGPDACTRISCQWGSAIWWCNDNDERKDLDSWYEITTAAEDLTRQCFWFARDKSLVTGGQIFQPGGWNVVIRHDDHDC